MSTVAALALAAAFLFALSAFLQQRAARAVVGADTASLRDAAGVRRLLGRLLRSRMWLIGWLTNLCGVGAQAAALKVGSVAAVQPLMAAQLLFVLSLAAGEQRRWPSVRDWLSALAVCAGLVLLLTADASPLTAEPHRHRVLLATASVVGLVVMLRQVSRHTFPWLASLLVGVAAGLCHALNAVYLKLTVEDLFHGGVIATLFDWPVYAMAVTAVSGMMLVQIAFASGPLPPAVAAMSVTNPLASFALGILAFDAPAPRDPAMLSAIAASGVLIAVGIVGLANASITRQLYGNAQLQHAGDAAEANVGRRAVLRLR
ncbi:DMT family transporter [Mycobacterium sp.]|uniref:DMT family transporter n=1 Tax=Mycobacterium sp. TaxID=1785 RepID=UPI002B6B88CB|nr:DMT family transporter [Mycobacterium sp.]HKP43522.1 DMT family transporter [Mycobacterium sp.]